MNLNIEEVKQFIEKQTPETRIYIGVDSERILVNDVYYAVYTSAIVVHINGNNGGKLFGEVTRERDFDRIDKPNTRLMTEVFKASELYLKLSDVLEDRQVEIHLDLNPDAKYKSNSVVQQAIGYIRGTCNVIPVIKPNAWAASNAADRFRSLKVANG